MELLKPTSEELFQHWKDICRAFYDDIQSNGWPDKEHPKYSYILKEYEDTYDSDWELLFIDKIEKIKHTNENLTKYLVEFVDTVVVFEYNQDITGTICEKVISVFLKYGAEFPYHLLFELHQNEDVYRGYEVRGAIIDLLKPEEYAKSFAKWEDIKGVYWEDASEDTPFEEERLGMLKYCSKYLQSL